MKKHRVIFINGPAEGQVHLLNPHYTRIHVMHQAGPGKQEAMAVLRAEPNMELTVTDDSVAITDYTISGLQGEDNGWYVAVTGGIACQDRILGLLIGKVTGEGYTSGYGNDSMAWSPYSGDPLREEKS